MTRHRATLADVARLAGVSLGSASRALSVPHEVRPATLERVQQAVAQLGYVRNGAAQALASRRTRTIAAIYPTLDRYSLNIFGHLAISESFEPFIEAKYVRTDSMRFSD